MRTVLLCFLVLVTCTSLAGGKKDMGVIKKTVRGFSKIDTNYVEPQHYNWTIMAQTTLNYDRFKLSSGNGQSVTLAPDMSLRVGPYFGWRWFFLGYTFDLKSLSFSSNGKKQEVEFSIYAAQVGIDLYYRRTGSDYKIRAAELGDGIDVSSLHDVPFDGINCGITGVNVYYIFNHKRFSYPAAFAQSTCQKISCGSWMAGIAYTHNSLSLDYDKLEQVISDYCAPAAIELDSGLMFNKVKYYNLSLSGGYAYNFVFAKNCLFCASGSVALAYKHSEGDVRDVFGGDFDFDNVNIDCIGRFGLVYNNTKTYAGASLIVNTSNYHKSRFSTNEVFGSLNIYVGYNFGIKSRYKRAKRVEHKL